MKLKYTFEVVEIGGEYTAVAVGDGAQAFHGVIQLNATGADILALLGEETDEDRITEALCRKYDGDPASIRAYVSRFVQELRDMNVME